MFYKQTPVKIAGFGLAAGCQVFDRKIYGFLYSVWIAYVPGFPLAKAVSADGMSVMRTQPPYAQRATYTCFKL